MASGLLDDYRQMAGLLGDYNAYADSLSPYELAMARAPRGQQEGLLGKVGKALYDTAKRRIKHPVKSYMEDNLGTIMALNPHMPSLWEMNPEMRQSELDTVAMKPGLLGDIAGPVADVNRYAANPDEWTALDTGLAGLGALPFVPALGGIIAGKGAKTADLVKLSKAEKMKAAGKDADTIYKDTGWWLDHPDGMPRFEIDDSAMKVNEYPNAPWEAYNSVQRNALIEDNGALRNMAAQMEPYKNMTLDQLNAEYSRTGKEIVDAAESGNMDLAKKLMKGRRGLDIMLSQMSQKRAGPMSDYVQHGLLSEAYPDVAHMHTRIMPNMKDLAGSYNPARPGIGEQIHLQQQPMFNADLRVPAHEMQHAVSEREGMAIGGTPMEFTKQKEAELARDALNWADELRAKRATMPEADISAVENALTKDYQDMGAMDWLPSREARDLASQPYVLFNDKYPSKQYDDLKNLVSLYGLDKQVSPRSGREIYHNLADESQARLVADRIGMTPEERQLLPFYHAGSGYGYDVPFDEMILRHGNGPALATVYHGSPHKFDKFSLEHIGKGEGAQAYGHGLYFAENPDVADIYRKNLTTTEKYVAGKPFDAYNPEHYLASILDQESGNVDETINFLEMMSKRGGSKSIKETANNSLKLLLEGERPVLGSIKPEGNFYKADIPDEAVANMLDWDAPLSEQPESVRKALADDIRNLHIDSSSGESIYNAMKMINQNDPEVASKYLHSIGIPGIKYYDGMSRAGGKGTRNFVVFDENLIKPISRNDEPLGLLNE